ncbi:Outer membrane protein assembly factor BamB [Serratia symbiotica]|nr:Outer membrane protein assembly factor BamB [Serratia symbiotica]
MKLCKTVLVWLVFALLLSACAMFKSEEDVVTMSPLAKVKNQFMPKLMWSTSVGEGVGEFYSHLRPAFQNGVLFAADRHGIVKAVDVSNGNEKWTVDLSGYTGFFSSRLPALLSGGLVLSGNRIYIGSEKGVVFGLNTDDGSVVWQARVASEVLSRPVISDGMVLIHTSNGQLQALNASDGEVKWTVNLNMPSFSIRSECTPAIAFGAAIIGSDNGRVSAVLLQQGQLLWQQRISPSNGVTSIDHLNDVDATPVIVEDNVYALGYNGKLVALDLRSGQVIWKRELGSVNDFIVDEGRIYLVDQNDRLLALSTEGGVTMWVQGDLLHRKLTPAVMFKGYLVTGDSKGYLHWLHASDGHFVSQHLVDASGFLSAPLVAEDKLVIQSRSGKIYTFTR